MEPDPRWHIKCHPTKNLKNVGRGFTPNDVELRNSPFKKFPSPLWEGLGDGEKMANNKEQINIASLFSPPPNLPRQGGGVEAERLIQWYFVLHPTKVWQL